MTSSLLLPLTSLFFFILAFNTNKLITYPAIAVSQQEVALNFKSETLSLLSVGLKKVISDVLWIQTLMDSDTDHYKNKDLNSWLYLRFSTIASLDPKFYENYYYGGQYLMIIKDDLKGSESLFKKGIQQYPDDVDLNWQLGYMYAIELGDYEKSIPYLDRIKFNPKRPKLFDSIFTRISNRVMGPQTALDYATSILKTQSSNDPIGKRLQKQIYSLRATLDLDCLNKTQVNCNLKDYYGNDYIKKGCLTVLT